MLAVDTLVSIAAPLLMGLVAVGALLMIKIARRREATATGTADRRLRTADSVPARPLSEPDASRMIHRYLWAAAAITAGIVAAGLRVAAQE